MTGFQSMGETLKPIREARRQVGPLVGQINQPEPDCVDCRDRGWYTLDVPVADARFGAPVRCDCQPPIGAARLTAFTELTPGMRSRTFDALGLSKANNNAQRGQWDKALAFTQAYAAGQIENPWLILAGSLGWGKTHLAVAILNWRIDHPGDGPPGKYVNCPDFLAALRQGIDDGGFEDTLVLYREVPLLLLDDLGAEYQRRRGDEVSWADEQIYRVMDYRYREKMPTIVTTNTPLDRVTPRLRDRLSDRALVSVFALDLPSYRTGEVL